jgi:hypothetical protein
VTRYCDCTDSPNISPLCICRGTADAVRHLASARRAFRNETAARLWLHTYCARLDGVPDELIRDGRGDDVVREARKVGTAA